MSRSLRPLDATYQARAVPPGTPRYWSWLFATPESRAPLLGIYALMAEWHALMDPATESGVARMKLAWWGEEMRRLAAGSPVHPIGCYLAALPHAAAVDFSPLAAAVEAAANQINGAPLEHAADLEPQSRALWANPMMVACRFAADAGDEGGLRDCTAALAAADYLSRAIADHGREARAGRVPFAVDELMAAGIENADLTSAQPPMRLQDYLERLRERGARYYELASQALPRTQRARHRHLLVLAALGSKHLNGRTPRLKGRRMQDMLLAWSTARRANR